ncbi:MAG: molybdopterin-binding protein [Methanocellales archaeon]|nr:molybdopterin-binding protein [Methanocellales archaeon]
MMRPFKSLISLEEALEIVKSAIKPIVRTEEIFISDANGRVLAEDVIANMDVPPFDRAAMDGYAVRAEDTYGANQFKPVILKLIDVVRAGEVTEKKVGVNECIQVATGCKMPPGADAVAMAEHAEQCEGKIKIFKPVHPRANVSGKGEDISAGSKVLSTGEHLNPSRVGTLAALGIQKVRVYERPEVAIVPTGSEVANLGCELKDAQVYDINSYTLSAIVRENGGVPIKFDVTPDNYEDVRNAMVNALKYDMAVFSGGSSVGESDILCDAVRELGDVLFHGVQIKPGKPILFGVARNKPVFGIPGYPTSCLSNGYRFLLPAARQLARLPKRKDIVVRSKLAQRVVSTLGRSQFLTVRLEDGFAHPVFKESGAITSMADADGYVDIPANVDLLEKGEEVDVILL